MTRFVLIAALLTACCGCAARNVTVASSLPAAAVAAPWVLTEPVWKGTFDRAAPALGDDAERWRPFSPTAVWLAVYRHETRDGRKLTARIFALPSDADARRAYEHFAPAGAKAFGEGGESGWTRLGVLIRRDRLVIEIFGSDDSWSSQFAAARLAGFVETKMPADLPKAPQ